MARLSTAHVAAAVLLSATATLAAAAVSPCGNATAAPTGTSVLVIGDSISMAVPYTPGGYGVPLQALLRAKGITAEHVGGWFAGGQASNTPKGLECTQPTTPQNYLNFTGTYDVVTINYGLHDLVNCTTSPECSEHVDVGTYAANIVTLLQRWAPRARHLVWVTTTPVPNVTTSLGRSYAAAVAYNAAAAAAIAAAFPAGSVTTADLWATVIAACGAGYTSCALQLPANVHFAPAGQRALATALAEVVERVLGIGGPAAA